MVCVCLSVYMCACLAPPLSVPGYRGARIEVQETGRERREAAGQGRVQQLLSVSRLQEILARSSLRRACAWLTPGGAAADRCRPDTLAKQRNTAAKEQNRAIKINRECSHSGLATPRPHLRMHTRRHFVFCIPALTAEKCQTASQPAAPLPPFRPASQLPQLPVVSQKGNAPAANKLCGSAEARLCYPPPAALQDGGAATGIRQSRLAKQRSRREAKTTHK